ncbi:MAG: transposase [Thermoplasmataceae archaeon]
MQIFDISYRSSGIFLTSHEEYLGIIDLKEIPSFQTLSRRARSMDLHAMNRSITFHHSMKECATVDSFMINTCKYSTAMRRKYWGNYKDPESGWSKTTRGWTYGRKCHMSLDIDSRLVMDWLVTKGSIHDSRVSHDMVDSVRNFSYILEDSAYDKSDIYDYMFENTHSLPIIDTNRRRGIVPERLSMNRKIGIDLRREYSSLYSLRWEIERTFSILEEIMRGENIWYTRNRSYNTAIGLKAIAYNIMIVSNIKTGNKPREIMKIVSC